jgi:hypothetical protein
MTKNDVLRKILNQKLDEIKARNPSYSKRKLALDSGVSSGSLIDFLNGKRDFSLKTINRLLENCNFNPNEIKNIEYAQIDDALDFDSLCKVIFEFNNEGVNEFIKTIKKLHRRCKKLEKTFSGGKTFKIEISKMDFE